MAHKYALLAAGLAKYFRRQGLTTQKGLTTGSLVRLAQRMSGKVCDTDNWTYLAEFARDNRVFAKDKKPKEPKSNRAYAAKLRANADPFFISREWQALRYRVLRDNDGKCQCCGATAKSSGKPLHVDHIQPRSKRPDLALVYSNLQVLCADCNLGKGNTDSINWKQRNNATAQDTANPEAH